jgi:hypothetical protein
MTIRTRSSRRRFVCQAGTITSAALIGGCQWPESRVVEVRRPGMAVGHQWRGAAGIEAWRQLPEAGALDCDVAIIGSGAAGLMAAWNLRRAGVKKLLILQGPVPHGNAAGTQLGGLPCPTAAHYLPLPSVESSHVRELLIDMQLMTGALGATRPSFAEEALVHAPSERLLHGSRWYSGLVPNDSVDVAEQQEISRFLGLVRRFTDELGNDGKRIFVVPIALSSEDEKWRSLDQQTFDQWLSAQQFSGKPLRWYLDYCCRDEFGAGLSQVSAWAGLHYFCSRSGHAANAADGAVMTWPSGLNPLLQHLQRGSEQQTLALQALHVKRQTQSVQIWATDGLQRTTITARKVIIATPLFVALGIDPEIRAAFAGAKDQLPQYRPWLVSNFYFPRAPVEAQDTELNWDNVVYGSDSLGFVNSGQQFIRRSSNPPTVLTTYHAFASGDAATARQWCANATQEQLLSFAAQDLTAAYSKKGVQGATQIQMNLHGHGMASPTPGFLSNSLLLSLRQQTGSVLYANADLSGYSVFEEATWWGRRAAVCCLS